jgi:osmotically-inducible protein OsmY
MSRPVRPFVFATACLLLAALPAAGQETRKPGGAPPAAAPPASAPPANAPPTGTPASQRATTPVAPPPNPNQPMPPASVIRNIGGPGDFGLREKLIKRIGAEPALANARLGVILVNGGVVLSGNVPNWTARRRALIVAGSMRGVVNVTDQMDVDRGLVQDGAILDAMASLLKEQHEALDLKDLDLSVADGVATIGGTVHDFVARVHAEDIAGSVLGASRIVNRLRPANAPSGKDDVSVRQAIITYLRDFREFAFPAEIQVGVSDGRARLTGDVAVYLARQQAGLMATFVGGVKAVDNEIEIDPSLTAESTMVTEAK